VHNDHACGEHSQPSAPPDHDLQDVVSRLNRDLLAEQRQELSGIEIAANISRENRVQLVFRSNGDAHSCEISPEAVTVSPKHEELEAKLSEVKQQSVLANLVDACIRGKANCSGSLLRCWQSLPTWLPRDSLKEMMLCYSL